MAEEISERRGKLDRVIEVRQEGILVLEDIHDPHNAAAVWRSADAFGWQKVWLIFEQEKPFNPKKIGKASSSSANKWLDFRIFKSTKECFEELQKQGYKTYATVLDMEAKDISLSDFGSQKKIAIVLGNEHRGLSETAIIMANEKVYIPMRGMVQSLNLSVTAAIMLYEVTRQRVKPPALRASPLKEGDYGLSDAEKEEIGKRWR